MKKHYWHIHHEVIAEPTEDIEERKEYVRAVKPRNQVSIRLRLMTPVKAQVTVGKTYEDYIAIVGKARKEYEAIEGKAYKEYEAIIDKAYEEYDATSDKAYKEYEAIADKTWKEYEAIAGNAYKEYEATSDKALKEYNAKLWGLHKKEHPDCPWNGKTIFPSD